MFKRIISLLIVLTLAFVVSCGDPGQTPPASENPPAATGDAAAETPAPSAETPAPADDTTAAAPAPSSEKRLITMGSWYEEYYTSDHQDIYADAAMSNEYTSQLMVDNMRDIEQKFNVEFRVVNLTWEGVIESINTSIMAGAPDCDLYLVDLQFGVPAVLNGYAQNLRDFLPADHDIFTDQVVMKYLNLMGDSKDYLFTPNFNSGVTGYPLGFNLDMIQEANLEDPRDVYERGEWTWDVWRSYLQQLTKDTNGDGVTDVYGWGGYWTNMLERLLFTNNTHIAADKVEGLSSPGTIEVMEFFNTIYNVDKSATPWNPDDWESNLRPFVDGKMAFFITADWIIQDMAESGNLLNYELGVVPWPYGPRGNIDSSRTSQTSGAYHIIPVGVEDPKLVYDVYHEYENWHKGDLELRDDDEWSRNQYLTERNYEMAKESVSRPGFDMWGMLGLTEFGMIPIMNGEKTPAQYAEEQKLIVQDRLDAYFGG
ncbi:MAG: ABC transporter substrate-binding protein [Clostridiales bacterium]|nr:ABC transporter substrate-binding protein [Clostridiales bacterium]